ncbi:hypothetical protein [Denitromonas iodatirespirans]|uniref:Uncharacterized protein n=1 Tax=Denitromonas iodatirespirans TaxID=2795389 RepID=A0A944DCJ5_DENI1|nr:hypothetical protein [Denitromonas iodatirespirans]MBT0963740.1 hypothetical protein [Denitromonas iodatirespirans]
MKVLAHYCYLLAALVVAVHLLTRQDLGGGLPVSATAIACGCLLVLGQGFTALGRRWVQRRRDARATRVLQRLLNASPGDTPPHFAVYLRPFSVTGRLTVTNRRWRGLPILPRYFAHEPTLEFERLLAGALAPALPLVALGRPGEAIGAGRIAVSDAEWKAMFQRLIDAARWIIMIPSDQGETGWEVQQLVAQGLLGKTVFIMPPALRRGAIDMAPVWRQLRSGLADTGLCLPAYTPAGQAFRLGPQGRFYRSRYLPRLERRVLREVLAGLTDGQPPVGWPRPWR